MIKDIIETHFWELRQANPDRERLIEIHQGSYHSRQSSGIMSINAAGWKLAADGNTQLSVGLRGAAEGRE